MYIKIGNTEIKYRTRENSFIIISEVLDSITSYENPVIVNTSDELNIWFGDEFTDKDYLEELLGNNNLSLYLFRPYCEKSFFNRDTLRLTKDDNVPYYYPVYSDLNTFDFSIEEDYLVDITLDNLDINKLVDEYQTYSFLLELGKDFLKSGWFLVIPTIYEDTTNRVLLYYDSIPNIPINLYDSEVKISSKEELLNELSKSNFLIKEINDEKYLIVSDTLRVVNYFYSTNLSGFSMTPNFRINNELITNKIGKNDKGVVEFVSKTIGGSTAKNSILEGSNILVEINKLDNSNYRVIISRFGYIEYFEGSFETTLGTERLDNLISKNSKLVYCNLIDDREAKNIPEGSWSLLGSYPEEYDNSMYMSSINLILDNEKSIFSDFILIPNLKSIVSSLNPDLSYYSELKTLKDLLESTGTQALIQNSSNGWKYIYVEEDPKNPEEGIVYVGKNSFKILVNGELIETTDREVINTMGNDFMFNYVDDLDNRLIYFYQPISLKGFSSRPGYYLFLKGFLEDIYSLSSKNINYESPTDESIISELKKKKSNYLVENNLYWYYEKYQNGDVYNTTGWMRFIIGKVSREIEKEKWNIISKKNQTEIRKIIESIISEISSKFSMIRTLNISEMNIDMISGKVDLTINTTISDLPENNFIIDVTLNYNS